MNTAFCVLPGHAKIRRVKWQDFPYTNTGLCKTVVWNYTSIHLRTVHAGGLRQSLLSPLPQIPFAMQILLPHIPSWYCFSLQIFKWLVSPVSAEMKTRSWIPWTRWGWWDLLLIIIPTMMDLSFHGNMIRYEDQPLKSTVSVSHNSHILKLYRRSNECRLPKSIPGYDLLLYSTILQE